MVEHPLGKGKVKDSSSFPGSVIGYVYILKSLKDRNIVERIVEEGIVKKVINKSWSRTCPGGHRDESSFPGS